MSTGSKKSGHPAVEDLLFKSSAQLDDHIEAFHVARAWPQGLRESERAYLATLEPRRRAVVLARLAAILDLEEAGEDGRDPGSIAAAAARAGSGRTAFHAIRVRWAASRSLEALAPWGRRGVEGSNDGDGFDVARAEVCKLLLLLPGERNGSVARIAGRNLGERSPSRPTLARIVQEERRRMSTTPEYLHAAYGAQLLVDLTAVSLALEDGTAVVVYVVIEEASLLILGHSTGTALHPPLPGTAAKKALLTLGKLHADGPGARGGLLLVAPDGMPEASIAALRAAGVTVEAAGPRRFGQKLTSRIGLKLGRLRFRPGATTAGFNLGSPTRPPVRLDIDKADALVAKEIGRHNTGILALLVGCGLAGPGVGRASGSMTLALQPVAAL